ncbi:MAG TPA: hypothetical protein PK297_14805 [Spirochaetota bacterium]|nr:hypothetical protein [Spirochaetota bacterium]
MDHENLRRYLEARGIVKSDEDWEEAGFFINSIGHSEDEDTAAFGARVAAAMRAQREFQHHIQSERSRVTHHQQ